MITSSVLGFYFGRNNFWPGIDALAPVQNMSNSNHQFSADLFVTSSSRFSGRTPYNLILKIFDIVLPFGSEFALSVLSSFTIMLSVPLIFLALISMQQPNLWSIHNQIPIKYFLAYIIYVSGILFILKLPYGGFFFIAGYGSAVSPWSTPEYFAMAMNGSGIIIMKNPLQISASFSKALSLLLVSFATLIHPVSSVFFLVITIILGVCFKSISKKEIYSIIGVVLTSYTFFVTRFNEMTNTLSSSQFVEIYSKWRHPHHFVPSYYLDLRVLSVYFLGLLLLLFMLRRSREHKVALISTSSIFVFSNIVQFVFVEIFPVQAIAAFGPSRINSYVPITLYTIVIHFLATRMRSFGFERRLVSRYRRIADYKLLLTLMMICFFTTSYVYNDYSELRLKTIKEARLLNLLPGDLILVDSEVNTLGFREFASVNIWFDDYFMFDLSGIEIYRQRWLLSCGPNPIGECSDLLTKGSVNDLYNMMLKHEIKKIVTSRPLDKRSIVEKFVFLGETENKWSYKLVSSRH